VQKRHYRLGSVDNIDAIFALNQQSFAESWSKKSLLDVMLAGFDLYVCEADKTLVGYALSQDVLDEVHIMQIAVQEDYQRQGIGSQLTQRLLSDKSEQSLILLEVRASNLPAQAMYEGLGFEHVGRRKGYYSPQILGVAREDALVMQRKNIQL